MNLLHPGDAFPHVELSLPDGGALELPTAFAGEYGVVLLFRGAWCPYCNAQLRAFQRAQERFAELGVRVAAVSVDDEATTRELVAKHELTYAVGHSADPAALREILGAFTTDNYLESTGFVIDPDGRVVVSVYSSAAIGRLVPDDVVGLIHYLRAHTAA
jgi:peroxiredoxin